MFKNIIGSTVTIVLAWVIITNGNKILAKGKQLLTQLKAKKEKI